MYEKTLELSPDAYVIQYNLGTVYWHKGELDKAEGLWRRALELNPVSPGVLYNLGLVAIQRGKFDQAADLLRRAVEQAPNLADPHLAPRRHGTVALAHGRRDRILAGARRPGRDLSVSQQRDGGRVRRREKALGF